MEFLRVVEVLPPLFPSSDSADQRIDAEAELGRFRAGARRLKGGADIVLVASVKDPGVLRFDSTHAAVMLQKELGVGAAPVVVTRDFNRPQFLSAILTVVSLGVKAVMVAWGDDLHLRGGASNVRDFATLAEAIAAASLVRSRAKSSIRILAPVNLDSLRGKRGIATARARLAAGADLLLAQPPTVDPGASFDRDSSLLAGSGLKGKTLLNVFPFRDEGDVRRYEGLFGWTLPRTLHESAARGGDGVLNEAKGVVRRLRDEGFPGVYLTARGDPDLAARLL